MTYNPDVIKHTLATIFQAQGENLAAEVLNSARAEISHVSHDFGMDMYCLDLRIPALKFAKIEMSPKGLDKLVTKIEGKLWKLGADPADSSLSRVRILPELSMSAGAVSIATPSPSDESRIWVPSRLRLFVSHVSEIRVQASALKSSLQPFGIDAFVAHADIEPSQNWRREIEFALRSMDALCALITDDFRVSEWCDQEAGYGLGRGVPVISVKYDRPPYGLMGENQAVRGELSKSFPTAERIYSVLAKQEHLAGTLTEGLVEALVRAPNFASAKVSIRCLSAFEEQLSKEQILRLLVAASENDQVREAINVPQKIVEIAERANVSLPKVEDDDDEIPF